MSNGSVPAALVVDGLSVEFATTERTVRAVSSVSFAVGRGETVAIVGESGSGKSVTALSLMRLVEHGGGRIVGGRLDFGRPDGRRIDLAAADGATMRAIRGAEIAMIFQEPMTSLNPVFTVGEQIAESIRLHQGKDRGAANAEALRMLEQVRIPEAAQVLTRYPHQLSGGMRQRVMIAMALSCRPTLLIADEPTTALDVTVQAQILTLIRLLQEEMQMAVIFITHDMGVVAEVADRVDRDVARREGRGRAGRADLRRARASVHEGAALRRAAAALDAGDGPAPQVSAAARRRRCGRCGSPRAAAARDHRREGPRRARIACRRGDGARHQGGTLPSRSSRCAGSRRASISRPASSAARRAASTRSSR